MHACARGAELAGSDARAAGNPDAHGVVIESKNDVSLSIPSSINLQSPAVKQAAAACHVRLPAR